MTKTSQEQLKNKFSLVYEYNRQSPLFVRAAENEIDSNKFHSAVEILQDGIKYFPDYPTAHIMLGKAFTRLGEYEKAEEEFVKGSELINSKKTLAYYINELEKTKRVDLLYLASRRIPFIPENFERMISDDEEDHQEAIEVIDEDFNLHPEETRIPERQPEDDKKREPIENRLEDLAQELSRSKFVVKENEVPPELKTQEPQEEEIVTETLAKILLSQGKFREAINVYKKLSSKSPEKETYFKEKITEIESQIGNW